ncbi:hypothetical protein [Methanospirillum hungatei]|nr:hypothetical protein [Methanospirillum hungatei]MCA1915939.1 molybdenum cofactor biosynthesis protein MoaE [Methanospirillum hungatei]
MIHIKKEPTDTLHLLILTMIAVAAGHRNEAFLAARYIIDE